MALSLQRYTRESYGLRDGPMYEMLKERSRKERERLMMIAFEKGDQLPECLIIEILSWMPVKDLLRYKSVSKSWYATISSPDFISKHLENYYKKNDSWRSTLLVQYENPLDYDELGCGAFWHYMDPYFVCELLIDETLRVLANERLSNGPFGESGVRVYGPCDGIYYLDGLRALWNPTIENYKELPELIYKPDLPSNIGYHDYEVYGFGIDPITRDYKVVVLKGYQSANGKGYGVFSSIGYKGQELYPLLVILVYSLRADSWKYCGELATTYLLENNKCYVYVNGCCYWLSSYNHYAPEQSEVIISFDMATDAYNEMEVPNYAKPSSACLAIYDESLALLSLHEIEKNFNIWTFKEGSWTKKFMMGPLPADIRKPIGHWKNNLIMLETKVCELVLIDPYSLELKYLAYKDDSTCLGVFAYMESLVSIGEKIKMSQHVDYKEDKGSDSDDDMGFT